MGGLLTLLCGDFRQILPVAPHGTPSNIVDAYLKSYYLWPSVTSFKLTTNMRVLFNADEGVQTFSEDLLCIGNGLQQIEAALDYISIHYFGKQRDDLKSFCDHIYPSLGTHFVNRNWLMQRAIPPPPPPPPHNDSAVKVNDTLMARIPTHTSVNSMEDEEQFVKFPAGFLNSIEVSGLSQHILSLKVGMPVMLLRSIKPPELMNGTRCIIRSCNRNTVEVEIAVGAHKGEIYLVPRIPLQPSDTTFPFKF